MVEVKPINISLDQHSPGLSVRTAISPTLTEEFIIHPSVYAEVKKLDHAKSDDLLNESGSSLSADSGVSFPNVSVSNILLWYPWKGKKEYVPLRTAYSQAGRCGMQPKAKHSLRTQAQLSETKTETMRTETVETFELVRSRTKTLKREGAERTREVREQALPSAYHCQTYLPF
ncbi:hypothetical protein TNCV_679871 [Trichonephila clavipes]|nr:hypothetical protein TNCV_679871 [Trichonephila clavipes]